jgi:hypothetical protein
MFYNVVGLNFLFILNIYIFYLFAYWVFFFFFCIFKKLFFFFTIILLFYLLIEWGYYKNIKNKWHFFIIHFSSLKATLVPFEQ